MKSFLLSATVALMCCDLFPKSAPNDEMFPKSAQPREENFACLSKQFANPGKEFRTVPLWVWNTNVSRNDIDRMLKELKDKGFGGAFIHPRPGLEAEYLSNEWFDLWEYSLNKGKELGLDIWIYDENSYPSGFAGGHVPDQMPESYNQGQALLGRFSHEAPKAGDCYLCLLKQGAEFRNITDDLDSYQGKAGDYYIYTLGYNGASTWTAGFPYVDLMVKGVTDKFIQITMKDGYEKRFGKRLGTEIKGTFTDEPQIGCPSSRDCRWTPDLFDTFLQMWGYDLRLHWPQLGEETGDWQKVRHDYNATLLHLFIERWSKPWHNYCEEHHLLWKGHYWEHNWPDLSQGPDNMAMYAWHQMPAIDMLFNQFDDNNNCQAQFGNIRSVKELRSVANQMGRVRTVSETYGGGGWDERFLDLKRLGDWEFALGVNFMNQHLSHMTITGARKFDYPPVFSSLSPWWQDYGTLNTYFARLSLVLSQGQQLNDWLILEPTTSLWLHYTQVAGGDPLWKIAHSFQNFVTEIEKNQMEYDLGCEDIIRNYGSVSSKGFRVGERTYKTVVLPPDMTNLEYSTFQRLRQFAKQGGRIITLANPTRLDGAESQEMKSFFQSDSVTHMSHVNQVLSLYQSESDVHIKCSQGSHLYHYTNSYQDGQLVFLVNSSLDENVRASVQIPGKYLYRLDAMNGEMFLQNQKASIAGNVQVDVTLYPAGSALYFATNKKILGSKPDSQILLQKPLQPLDKLDIHPVRPNALNLDFCNLTVDGETQKNLYHKEANTQLWKHFGTTDPWETAVQFRHDILDCDTFTRGDITVEYPFYVSQSFDMQDLQMIVEKPEMWQVSVNGTPINEWQVDSILDVRCGDFLIGEAVHQGTNTIRLHMNRMNIRVEIAPVILMGQFGLMDAPRGFVLTEKPNYLQLGNYATQGYQMYPWGMAYCHTYQIDQPQTPCMVQLDKWNGTVAQVWVNNQKAGIIAFPPYQLDITDFVQKGENRIEVRTLGSLANLYGPHYSHDSGIMGPWNWNGIQEQLPGQQYRFFPYGLESDFTVLTE